MKKNIYICIVVIYLRSAVMKSDLKLLLDAVEKKVGKALSISSDFEKLAKVIYTKCEEHLSPAALKHLWSCMTGAERPTKETLDKLSLFVGFQDWHSFQDALHGDNDAQVNFEGEEKEPDGKATPPLKKLTKK
jgi:hypothetical protein